MHIIVQIGPVALGHLIHYIETALVPEEMLRDEDFIHGAELLQIYSLMMQVCFFLVCHYH